MLRVLQSVAIGGEMEARWDGDRVLQGAKQCRCEKFGDDVLKVFQQEGNLK
jgi:hypothetical protein